MKVGILIPAYMGNPENVRCKDYLLTSIGSYQASEPDTEFFIHFEFGPHVPAPIDNVVEWAKHDRAIAKCRWDGTAAVFAEGADWCVQVDSDVMVPTDFFYHMLHAWRNAEAKTCHVVGTDSNKCRHIDFPASVMLPDTVDSQPIAGEIIMLKRSLWERMDKHYQPEGRANEDFEIAQHVRDAGCVYWLVNVRCYSD